MNTNKKPAHMRPGAVVDEAVDEATDEVASAAEDAAVGSAADKAVVATIGAATGETASLSSSTAAAETASAPTDAQPNDVDAHLKALEEAEYAIERAFATGKADRAAITQRAHDRALEAADLVADAMEADAESDELARMAIIAENSKDKEKIKAARNRSKTARKEAKAKHKEATKVAKDAYESIKFSQPGKLGFVMRAVQVGYAFNIVATLFALLYTSRDVIVYDSFTILSWIEIILQGVGFWFFINYYKVARPFVIITSAISLVVPAIFNIATGHFDPFTALLDGAWNIFLIIYFWRSKRVREVLVNDFSTLKPTAVGADFKINRKGWPYIRNLIMYFIVFSVLGHWMEAAMCQLIRLGLVQGEYDPTNTMLWRDWLYPYPMEGAAVVVIAVALYPLWQYFLKKWPDKPLLGYVLSFVVNGLTCGIIEFSMGLIVNSNHQLWDYSDMPFNFMGQVCLQNMLAFAAAASIITWVVYPMLERWLARIPNDTMNIIFVVIAIIGGILWSLYIIDPPENHVATEVIEATAAKPSDISHADLAGMVQDEVSLGITVEDMQEQLDNATSIDEQTRAELQQEIDALNASSGHIAEIIGRAA